MHQLNFGKLPFCCKHASVDANKNQSEVPRRLLDHFRHCMISCQLVTVLSERQVNLAGQTLSISMVAPFSYQIRVLEVIGTVELACETKPTVCKHKQQVQPSQTSMN